MSKIIENQLKQVKEADLSNYDKDTNSYFIPKRKDIKLEEGSFYLLELKDSLFSHNSSLEQIMNNFNNGDMPKHKYYQADIVKKIGNMIMINGVEFDIELGKNKSYVWSGWLPVSEINVLKELN